jgi:hypothetical protein
MRTSVYRAWARLPMRAGLLHDSLGGGRSVERDDHVRVQRVLVECDRLILWSDHQDGDRVLPYDGVRRAS